MKIARYTVLNDNFTKYFSIKLKIDVHTYAIDREQIPIPKPKAEIPTHTKSRLKLDDSQIQDGSSPWRRSNNIGIIHEVELSANSLW